MATLNFKGKTFVQNHHLSVKYHQLIPKKDKSFTDKVSLNDNLIIHGDNLIALKALLPTYAGKIKCIYIDPPYNTGNEKWVYNDNVNSPMMQEWLGKVVDKEDFTRHDKWLCMMMPRLKLLKELLRDDGVIFVSIDDNEMYHLRMVMDEIFSEKNFIASLVWEGALKNDSRFVSVSHDYIICYARNIDQIKILDGTWRTRKEGIDAIYKKADELKKKYGTNFEKISESLKEWFSDIGKKHPAYMHKHYNKIDNKGVYFPSDISWPGGGGPSYQVLHPLTKKPVLIPKRGWVFPTSERMQEAINEDKVDFGDDEKKVPTLKRYLHETEGQVLPSVFYQDRRAAMQRLRNLFGSDIFENPKDENIIIKLLQVTTRENDIILDSFAGSGTTAHAVLDLNAEDGGNRKFILVECEDYADKITAERVRRVIKDVIPTKVGIQKNPKILDSRLHGNDKTNDIKKGFNATFSYFELGEPIEMESILEGKKLPDYMELARYIFYTATGEEFNPTPLRPPLSRGELKGGKHRYFIGETKDYEVYLFYEPDIEKLKKLALTLDTAKKLGTFIGKKRLVFAPAKYLDLNDADLIEKHGLKGIEYCQLPFEIYKMRG